MRRLTARHIRMALGALWLLDAALQARGHFFSQDWWHDDLAQSVMGQPALVSRSILWATGLLAPHAVLANLVAVAIQATIGLCLLAGRFERLAIVASALWALAVWWVGEGFGALPTGFGLLAAGAPGPVMIYPLIGFIAWPSPAPAGGADRTARRSRLAIGSWVVLWAGGSLAGLASAFSPARVWQANIEMNGSGQPGWLSSISHDAYGWVGSHPGLVPAVLFAAQVLIGLGVLSPLTRGLALWAGAVLSLGYWFAVQGMGGLAAGSATDPGAGPLMVLLALCVAAVAGAARPPLPRWRPGAGRQPRVATG